MHIWIWPFAATVALAEEEPIVTDRPDFTESAIVVTRGRTQLESGFTLSKQRGRRAASGPEVLIRAGVAKNWEIRLGAPDHTTLRMAGERESGWGDASIGFKHQVGPLPGGVDLAVIVAASLPTGEIGFGSREPEPEIRLCVSRDLNERDALSAMLAGFWPAEAKGVWQATLSFGRDLGQRWGYFLEWAADGERHEPTVNTIHSGFTFRRTDREQWDIHFGYSPDGERARFLAAGYSIRQ